MHRDPTRNPDQRALHADHTRARAHGGHLADRLLHATCNERRGDGTRNTSTEDITNDHSRNRHLWTRLDW